MIYLMRHGQDDESYIGGWSDVALIDSGIDEVKRTSEWINENILIKQILCSDILRARQTAEIVNSYLKVPICYSSELREQNKGLLNGAVVKEVETSKYSHLLHDVKIDTVYPNGESLYQLYCRINEYLDKIINLDDSTLIITHRGVINIIYYILEGKSLDMNKKQFGVETASLHELDTQKMMIKRIR